VGQSLALGESWWELTPRSFFALLENHQKKQQREERRGDLHFGLIAATIANSKRSKESDKIWEPEDFFPQHRPEPREMSDEEIFNRLEGRWGEAEKAT
jgi:hypothetical protein